MAKEKQITTRIPEELHRRVKVKVAITGRTITEVLKELLEKWVEEERDARVNHRARHS